jgi:hypothetical protein
MVSPFPPLYRFALKLFSGHYWVGDRTANGQRQSLFPLNFVCQ